MVEVPAQIDRAAELAKQWRTAPGQAWAIGPHRLVCGDCREKAVVGRLWRDGGAKIRLVWTDPPYGVSYADKNRFLNKSDRGNRIQKPITNDHLSEAETWALFRDGLAAVIEHCEPGASIYVTVPSGPLLPGFIEAMISGGFTFRHLLVWIKQHFVIGMSDYHYRHEPILYGWLDGGPHYFVDDRTQDSVFEVDRPLSRLRSSNFKTGCSSKSHDREQQPQGRTRLRLLRGILHNWRGCASVGPDCIPRRDRPWLCGGWTPKTLRPRAGAEADRRLNRSTEMQERMDAAVEEWARRIPADQIPYAVASLLVRFWTECDAGRNSDRNGTSAPDSGKLLTAGQLCRAPERAGELGQIGGARRADSQHSGGQVREVQSDRCRASASREEHARGRKTARQVCLPCDWM